MPIYVYQCRTCGHQAEELHSMKECDNPDSKFNKCRLEGCEDKSNGDIVGDDKKCDIHKVPQLVGVSFFEMLDGDGKRQAMAKRAKDNLSSELKERKKVMDDPKYIP